MSKTTADAREKLQREAQQAQQEAALNQQKAETSEVAGRQRPDVVRQQEGNDKAPRGQ
jgi:hypothetical protein